MKQDTFFNFETAAEPVAKMHQAILIHRTANMGESSYYNSNNYIASLHDMHEADNGRPVIGAGRLLAREDIEAILRLMLDIKPAEPFLIPKNILSYSDRHIVWTVPGRARPMLFNFAGKPVIKLDAAPWPNLLFVATAEGKLHVAALKTNARPTGKTRLYNAPLMNVGNRGEVCTGTAAVPTSCGIDDLPAWESLMFNTAFSHVNNRQTLRLAEDGDIDTNRHFKFWKNLSKSGAGSFPTGYLVPLGQTLDAFMLGAVR